MHLNDDGTTATARISRYHDGNDCWAENIDATVTRRDR
jgi:hypothetical protein